MFEDIEYAVESTSAAGGPEWTCPDCGCSNIQESPMDALRVSVHRRNELESLIPSFLERHEDEEFLRNLAATKLATWPAWQQITPSTCMIHKTPTREQYAAVEDTGLS